MKSLHERKVFAGLALALLILLGTIAGTAWSARRLAQATGPEESARIRQLMADHDALAPEALQDREEAQQFWSSVSTWIMSVGGGLVLGPLLCLSALFWKDRGQRRQLGKTLAETE